MKKIIVALTSLFIINYSFYSEELHIKYDDIKKELIKEGFPSSLLTNYSVNSQNLPQLLKILAILNTYGTSHNLSLNYDTVAQDWVFHFDGYPELYWAYGHLLPYEEKNNLNLYLSYFSYFWQEEAVDMNTWPKERLKRFAHYYSTDKTYAITYHGLFHHILYGGNNKKSIEDQLVEVPFLNTKIKINKIAVSALQRVQKTIIQQIKMDLSLKKFLLSLIPAESYIWRHIEETSTISYHAYGIAIDINPIETTKPIYWLWERNRNPQWYLITPSDRWEIHPKVLKAFLDEGFLWGGSWALYDVMHFEYRPELKELSRLTQLFIQ